METLKQLDQRYENLSEKLNVLIGASIQPSKTNIDTFLKISSEKGLSTKAKINGLKTLMNKKQKEVEEYLTGSLGFTAPQAKAVFETQY